MSKIKKWWVRPIWQSGNWKALTESAVKGLIVVNVLYYIILVIVLVLVNNILVSVIVNQFLVLI